MAENAENSVEDPLIGTLLADRYRVTRLAGEGGMGRVYLGEHEAIGRRVAIKCLLPEMSENSSVVERFENEARAATAAGSEHIIDVFDMGRLPDGAPFMVMEFLDGEDLGEMLEREGAQPVGRVARIMGQVCDALEAAHTAGIVHRDLKPENIFLLQRKKSRDFVKVLDFGISKFTEQAAGMNKHLTQTGVTVGTPLYMSPEQAQGLKTTDHRTDIYALGCILYEALTGDPPYDADSFALLIVKIVTGDTPDVRVRRPDVPAELANIITQCLSKDPAFRFPDVETLGRALERFESMDDSPQLLEARGSRATSRPGQAPTRGDGGPPTGAALPAPRDSATLVGGSRREDDTPIPRAPSLFDDDTPVPRATLDPTTTPPSSSAPSSAPSKPASNRILFAGVALAVLGAVAAGVALSLNSDPVALSEPVETPVETPRETPPVVPPVEPPPNENPPEGEEVRLRVVVAPAEAKIFLDDVEYPSPLDARVARSLTPSRLRIELQGYETVEEVVLLDQDREILKMLTPSRGRTSMSTSMTTMETTTTAPMEETPMTTTMTTTMDDGFRDNF